MLHKQMHDTGEEGYERPYKVYVGNLPQVSKSSCLGIHKFFEQFKLWSNLFFFTFNIPVIFNKQLMFKIYSHK